MPIGFDRGETSSVPRTEIGRSRTAPLVPVIHTRWETREDERVCPECGPLDGQSWEENAGPTPPLHNHCRCQRVFAYVEWRTRFTD